MSTPVLPHQKSSLLRNRKYALWLIGDTCVDLSADIISFAIPILMLMTTNSPEFAGLVATLTLLVRSCAAPISGVLADRASRSGILAVTAGAGAVIAGLWWCIDFFAVQPTGVLLLVVSLLFALRNGLAGSASMAALADVVSQEEMGPAMSANQGRDAVLSLGAAPLAGLLIPLGGWVISTLVFALNLLAGFLYVVLHHKMPKPEPAETVPNTSETETRNGWKDFCEGLIFLWHSSLIKKLLVSLLLINIGIQIIMISQIYSLQQAGTEVFLISIISSAVGVGTLIGAVLSAKIVKTVGGGKLLLVSMILCFSILVGLLFSAHPYFIIGVFALAFLLVPTFNTVANGLLMLIIPQELLGRVISVIALLSIGATSLPPLIVGFGLDAWGREALVALGLACIGCSVLIMARSKTLRRIPAADQWGDYSDALKEAI